MGKWWYSQLEMVSIKRNSKGEFAEAKGLRTRPTSIYKPGQKNEFKISRSKFSNFMKGEHLRFFLSFIILLVGFKLILDLVTIPLDIFSISVIQ